VIARVGLVALVGLVGLSGIAAARPGGGESYSGGGGHNGGGGSGGAAVFELIYWLIRIVFVYPVIGLPILALIIGYVLRSAYRQQQNKDWDSGPPVALHQAQLAIKSGVFSRLQLGSDECGAHGRGIIASTLQLST
jgi:hypothetical protein